MNGLNLIKKEGAKMIKKNCPALDETTEIKKINIGNTSQGPIIIEKEDIVDQYCRIKKTNLFNCDECNHFK